MGAAAVLGIAAVAGVWAGQNGHVRLPLAGTSTASPVVAPAPSGPVIYYRDPDDKGLYSDTPKMTADGRPYIGVRASEDVSVDKVKPPVAVSTGKIKFYRNPMGLPDTSPTPKKDSMGMDYIPVMEGETEDGSAVKLSPGKVQRAGVETVLATRRASTRTIKAPGVVAYDERRIWAVVPRFDGFVERIEPVTTGQNVKKGDALVAVFGQEILAQGSRLIIEQAPGWKGEDTLNLRTFKGESGTVIGAYRRLRNLGVPDEFIEQIKRERRVPDTLTVRSPVDGVIIERNIVQGQAFKAGEVAFRIADHSVMWVNADVPEGDMAAITTGQRVSITTRAYPGRRFTGVVALVLPHLMKETRTARVRIELANADLALLPDMYVDVEIATGGGEAVVSVPTSAVIDSGNRQVVIVQLGDGRFEPRDVKLGRCGDGMTEVTTGIADGDSVVANGNFLIDAESNLQAALKGLTPPASPPATAEAKP
jgi:Cu(I)/Ag(I) efflux system membrane fusion protein